MSSKHLANRAQDLVSDALSGLAYCNPAVQLDPALCTLVLRQLRPQVQLLSFGGAGHEPAHSGFVGAGMLSASVAGKLFASPSSRQVEHALAALAAPVASRGTLVLVKQYTGDVLTGGLAKERWTAGHPSPTTNETLAMLVVGDDVSIGRSQIALTGRRGLAGIVLVHKVAGALAASDLGASLEEVAFVARVVAERAGTIGCGLDHADVLTDDVEPVAKQTYLMDNEIEIGMGIHNEPGFRKVSPIPPAAALVHDLLTVLTNVDDKERAYLDFKHDGQDAVVLLVNNLGGLSEIELAVVMKEAGEWLAGRNIIVERAISGLFMSALNLPGCSISLILLPRAPVVPDFESQISFDAQTILDLLDAPTEAPGWKWFHKGRPGASIISDTRVVETRTALKGPAPTDSKLFARVIEAACHALIKAEPELTQYDTMAGDGDAGHTLRAGARAVLKALDDSHISTTDVAQAMRDIADVVEDSMGGTSGGLYAIAFNSLSKHLAQIEGTTTEAVWSRALELMLNSLYGYTLARPPSRTLIDPLAAFILTLAYATTSLAEAFAAAEDAARATVNLEARIGRAAYVDQEALKEQMVPDAGAWGMYKLLAGIQSVLI